MTSAASRRISTLVIRLPVRLRDQETEREIEIETCGSDCRRMARERLVAALPGRAAGDRVASPASPALLLVTRDQTIVKPRRHTHSTVEERLGLPFRFDLDRHQQALEILRRERPTGISRPQAECACSYELEFLAGRIPCPIDGALADQLARRYVTCRFADRDSTLAFLGRAWAAVSQLHHAGIQHGDPSYHRFLVDGDRVSVIDLDEVMVGEASPEDWDLAVFVWTTYVPLLSDFAPPTEMVELLPRVVAKPVGSAVLTAAMARGVMLDRTVSALRRAGGDRRRASPAGPRPADPEWQALFQGVEERLALVSGLHAEIHARDTRLRALSEALRTKDLTRWRRRWIGPRLGVLWHHPPRPLMVPPRYHRPPRLAHLPRISLVTPVLDAARFVEDTVRSVIEQEYGALEYLIQDGGSSDGTLDVLARYRHATAELRSEPDEGQADAVNRGLARASGEILAYLNADDVLLPGALHYVAAYLARHPEVDVVYGHRVLIDEDNREIGRWVLPRHDDQALSWADYVPQETLFWRRRIWQRVGGYLDVSFQFAMDWDLLLRFRGAGARIVRVPRFLGAFRVHQDQKSTSRITDIGAAEMARLRERVHGRPVSEREISWALRGYHIRHVICHKLYRLGVLRY